MKELEYSTYKIDKETGKLKKINVYIKVEGDKDFDSEYEVISFINKVYERGNQDLVILITKGHYDEVVNILNNNKNEWKSFSNSLVKYTSKMERSSYYFSTKVIDYLSGRMDRSTVSGKVKNVHNKEIEKEISELLKIIDNKNLIIDIDSIKTSKYIHCISFYRNIPQIILLKLEYKYFPVFLSEVPAAILSVNNKLLEYKFYEFLRHNFPDNKIYWKKFLNLQLELEEDKIKFIDPSLIGNRGELLNNILLTLSIAPPKKEKVRIFLFYLVASFQSEINEGITKIGEYKSLEEYYNARKSMINNFNVLVSDFISGKTGKKIRGYLERREATRSSRRHKSTGRHKSKPIKKKELLEKSSDEEFKPIRKGKMSRKRSISSEESSDEESSGELKPIRKMSSEESGSEEFKPLTKKESLNKRTSVSQKKISGRERKTTRHKKRSTSSEESSSDDFDKLIKEESPRRISRTAKKSPPVPRGRTKKRESFKSGSSSD